ncbi:hypothetical protein [Microbacterium sp. XT11]|uniref:hypothetical protein n=1 Tax=Microbacterium sp. XT11 TaxID=367477 RepID=UPI00083704A2|nr:hypothetical protein [Microbacterium sp. XT11]
MASSDSDYYRGPDDDVLDRAEAGSIGGSSYVYFPPEYFSVLADNHNLITSTDPENRKALDAMARRLAR